MWFDRNQGTTMPLARINGRILHFIHIPKTGGTALENYMKSVGSVSLLDERNFGWSKCTAQHLHADLHLPLIPDGFADATFGVIRDPLQRMLSEYEFRRSFRPNEFPPFERWLPTSLQEYGEDPYLLDNHMRPQVAFFRPGMVLFSFADGLEAVRAWIERTCDLPPGPPLTRDNVAKAEKPVPSAWARAEIYRTYAEDFEMCDLIAGKGPVILDDDLKPVFPNQT